MRTTVSAVLEDSSSGRESSVENTLQQTPLLIKFKAASKRAVLTTHESSPSSLKKHKGKILMLTARPLLDLLLCTMQFMLANGIDDSQVMTCAALFFRPLYTAVRADLHHRQLSRRTQDSPIGWTQNCGCWQSIIFSQRSNCSKVLWYFLTFESHPHLMLFFG